MFDSFDLAWQYFKKHGLGLGLFFMLLCLFIAVLNYLCFPQEFWAKYEEVVLSGDLNKITILQPYIEEAANKTWIVNIVQFLLMMGVFNIANSIVSNTYKGILADFRLTFLQYLKLLEVICIVLLVVMFSSYLSILLSLSLLIMLQFAVPHLIAHKDDSPILALKASIKVVMANPGKVVALDLLCILVLIIGVICLFVGIYFAFILALFAYLIAYKNFTVSNLSEK